MVKILFWGHGFHGHINPTLPIVKALVQGGDKVIYYASKEMKNKIEAVGAEFLISNLYDDVNDIIEKEKKVWMYEYRQSLQDAILGFMKKIHIQLSFYHQVQDEIKKQRPNLIIYDSFNYVVKKVSDDLRIPAISSITGIAYHKDMMISNSKFVLEEILRLNIEQINNKEQTLKEYKRFTRIFSNRFHLHNVDFIDMCYTNYNKFNILYTERSLQPYSNLFKKDFMFIGPPDPFKFINKSDKEWKDNKKIIYISFGTLHVSSLSLLPLYDLCLRAFDKNVYQVYLYASEEIKIHLKSIPFNAFISDKILQHKILPITDLFITHGGMNSVNESIYCKVPMILIPLMFDNYFISKQVERIGAGIYLDYRNINKDIIVDLGNKILYQNILSSRINALSKRMRKLKGYQDAIEGINNFKLMNGIK